MWEGTWQWTARPQPPLISSQPDKKISPVNRSPPLAHPLLAMAGVASVAHLQKMSANSPFLAC
jgi:hypothetical protein